MTKIIPIRDLKDTSKISEMCHSADTPIFITKNGYEDMVIMSAKVYDQLCRPQRYTTLAQNEIRVADNAALTYNADVYSLDEIIAKLKPIFEQFKVKTAILFGSYAKGCAHSRSDIDILVDSGLNGLKFFGLLNEVAESFKCPVDLIDVIDLKKNSSLEKEIEKNGIKIYG